jgi:hypothetical protein
MENAYKKLQADIGLWSPHLKESRWGVESNIQISVIQK